MATSLLLVSKFLLTVIFFAGIRERIVNIPKWFASPPASFQIIREQAKGSARFWIPLQILFLLSSTGAFIANWSYPPVKKMMIFGAAAFIAAIVMTATYFVKEIMYFSKIPADAVATQDLLRRTRKWYNTTVLRNIVQGVALVFFIIATIRSMQL